MINRQDCFIPSFGDNHKEHSLGLVNKSPWSQLGPQVKNQLLDLWIKDCYFGLTQIMNDYIWIGPSVLS